jgi:hypothetical protein
MNDYEMADLAASYFANAIAHGGSYFTTVSAYLIVAYTVGDKLKPPQIFLISGLFLLFAVLSIWGSFANSRWAAILVESAPEVLPRAIPGDLRPFHIVVLLEFCGVLASLKFMWDVRHAKKSAT